MIATDVVDVVVAVVVMIIIANDDDDAAQNTIVDMNKNAIVDLLFARSRSINRDEMEETATSLVNKRYRTVIFITYITH